MSAKQAKSKTRREQAAEKMAAAIVEWLHMMYNKQTSRGVMDFLIEKLQERRKEFD